MITVRSALNFIDALINKDPRNFSLFADDDNVLIKEQKRGKGNLADSTDATIDHNLGYLPFFLVYVQVSSGTYRIANKFDPLGAGWRVYTTRNSLIVQNRFGSSGDYKYFIFYDNIN